MCICHAKLTIYLNIKRWGLCSRFNSARIGLNTKTNAYRTAQPERNNNARVIVHIFDARPFENLRIHPAYAFARTHKRV